MGRKTVYVLEYFNNCRQWQVVDQGTKEAMDAGLKRRSDLFHDADRYRIRVIKILG